MFKWILWVLCRADDNQNEIRKAMIRLDYAEGIGVRLLWR